MKSGETTNQIRTVNVETACAPIRGHYSHASELPNGVIYLSGQKAWTEGKSGPIVGNILEQTHVVFDHLEAILRGLKLELSNVTRLVCYLRCEADYAGFDQVYAERLKDHKPARAVVTGVQLRDDAAVEIVADAFRTL